MSFIPLAWTAAILYGLVAVIGKFTTKYSIRNQWMFNFLWNFISMIITLFIALGNNVGMPNQWNYILTASLFNALFSIFYIFSLSNLDVSVFTPLFNLRTAISVLLGGLLLGEQLTFLQSVFVMLIIVGGITVSMDEKFSLKSFINKHMVIALLAMISLSLNSIFINKAMSSNGYWEVTLWMAIITQLFFLITVPLFRREVVKIHVKNIFPVILMSLSLALGNLASNAAFAINVGITSAIVSLPMSMIFVFLLSFIAPNLLEKHSLKVYLIRFSSAGIMIWSALNLSR